MHHEERTTPWALFYNHHDWCVFSEMQLLSHKKSLNPFFPTTFPLLSFFKGSFGKSEHLFQCSNHCRHHKNIMLSFLLLLFFQSTVLLTSSSKDHFLSSSTSIIYEMAVSYYMVAHTTIYLLRSPSPQQEEIERKKWKRKIH